MLVFEVLFAYHSHKIGNNQRHDLRQRECSRHMSDILKQISHINMHIVCQCLPPILIRFVWDTCKEPQITPYLDAINKYHEKDISNFKQHVFPLQAHLLCRLSFSCKQPTITQFCVSLGTWIGVMSPTSSTNPMAGEPWQLWWRSLRIPFSCWATRMEASATWKRMEPLRRDRPMLD